MTLAVPLTNGVFVDLRYSLIAISALFGGPVSALLTMGIASLFRLFEGGAGAIDGVISIAFVGAVSICGFLVVRKRSVTLVDAGVLGAIVSGVLMLMMSRLPSQSEAQALELVGMPMMVLNFASILISAFFLIQFDRMVHDRDILSAALSQAPDFHYVKDLEGKFVVVNSNVAQHHHYSSPTAMVGLSDFELETRRRAETLYVEEQEVMRSGMAQLDKVETLRVVETERCFLTSKVPLRDRKDVIIGLAGVTRDVTEQKRIEQQLRESKDLLSLAMAGMSDGFAMFDRAGTLVFCNAQYTEMFPLSAAARVPGANIRDILRAIIRTQERKNFPTEVSEAWIEEAATSLHRDKDEQIELSNGHWLSLRTRLTADGTALIAVSDITVMKEAEFALRSMADQMKGLAETDGLTGLVNRRAFDQTLATAAEKSALTGEPLALMMVDVDRFKAFNDTYGHLEGDRCLKAIADCLRLAISRPGSVLARFGGEEFVVLLENTDEDEALALAEAFRTILHAKAIAHKGSEFGFVTASIGLTVKTALMAEVLPADIVRQADQRLYEAKRSGRDRVCHRLDMGEIRKIG